MTKIIDKRGCNEDWKQTLEQGFLAVEKGREILLDYFGHLTQVTEKAQAGLVSEADVKSEKAIVECLLSQFPNHHIIGEEQSFESSHQGPVSIDPSVPTWIIDPLDGTTNYVHRFHVFCISIGLHYQGE
ncbi:MAG: inositol monophosphatase, partial [Bdellovibrionales bacterium]|nr:inositol monophosphatase [Bdellovibrionales bacterium]